MTEHDIVKVITSNLVKGINTVQKRSIKMIRQIEGTNGTADTSQRNAAIVAGVGLLLMSVAHIIASFVYNSVLVPGDAAATANNILANELQFRLAVLGFLFVIVLDVIVAWGRCKCQTVGKTCS